MTDEKYYWEDDIPVWKYDQGGEGDWADFLGCEVEE